MGQVCYLPASTWSAAGPDSLVREFLEARRSPKCAILAHLPASPRPNGPGEPHRLPPGSRVAPGGYPVAYWWLGRSYPVGRLS